MFSADAGRQSFVEAVLQARGDIEGPCDREALERLDAAGKLSFAIDEERMRAAEVHMASGSQREGFVLAAAIQALQDRLQTERLSVRETGFTSCEVAGNRCALLSHGNR